MFRKHVGIGIDAARALFKALISGANDEKNIVRIRHSGERVNSGRKPT